MILRKSLYYDDLLLKKGLSMLKKDMQLNIFVETAKKNVKS